MRIGSIIIFQMSKLWEASVLELGYGKHDTRVPDVVSYVFYARYISK